MENLELFFTINLGAQLLHSLEELTNKFHEKFPPFKMSFRFFLIFEIVFFLFWLAVLWFQQILGRSYLMTFFLVLMFANGIWHLVWGGIEKKYVPGLVTAPIFVILFLIFYFQLVF